MNDLIATPRRPRVQLIPRGEQVRCVAKTHPFLADSVRVEYFAQGATLADMVEEMIPPRWLPFAHVWIGGVKVYRRGWHLVRPKAGALVEIGCTPMGGDGDSKGVIGVILGALLIVIGIALVVFTAGLGAKIGAFLIKTGIGLAIGGVAAMLAPNPSLPALSGQSDQKKDSPTYFLQGARNQARPFDPVRRLYGLHRIVPEYGAATFTETVGDDQYLRLLFLIGHGPLELSDFRIGQTPLSSFQDVETEVRNGFPYDAPFTLFPAQVKTEQLAATLTQTFQERRTDDESDEIIVEVDFPRGLVVYNDEGEAGKVRVRIDVEYKLVADSTWTTAPQINIFEKKTEPFRRGLRIQVARGQYDVRLRRTNNESTSTVKQDQAVWSALKTIKNEDPLNHRAAMFRTLYEAGAPIQNYRGGLAAVAMRIRASDQLSGVVDTFNCLARSIVPDYDSFVLDFDGANDILNCGQTHGRSGALARSIECWAYARAQAGALFQAGDSSGNDTDFSLVLTDPATETWRIIYGDDEVADVAVAGTVGAWHHYALTYDGADIVLCVDGVEVERVTVALDTALVDLKIGTWGGGLFFSGQMREFCVRNIARTPAQILADYEDAIDRDASLLHYWRMNEGSGEKIYDYGQLGAHLTLSDGQAEFREGGATWLRWEPRPTSNPASAFRDALQGQANARPVADARIDMTRLEHWHKTNRDRDADLDCRFQMIARADAYHYRDLTDVGDYESQAGDVLEYEIYIPDSEDLPSNPMIGVDLANDSVTLRGGSAVDQNALAASPATDISEHALGAWYARRIALPAEFEGETITYFMIGCELNSGGAARAYIRNIRITDGAGTIRHAIWTAGDASPAHEELLNSTDANSASIEAAVIRELSKGRNFNFAFDVSGTMFEALQTIASAGRASFTMRDSLFSVIVDEPRTVPVQHFTPRNISDFRGVKAFRDIPHAIRIRFVDENQDYEQSEITVYDDGYTSANATLIEAVDLKGTTHEAEAYRTGRYLIAAARLRPEAFELTTDFENLRCQRGDLVHVTHDVASIGLATGRIKSLTVDGGNITHLVLDDICPMEAGTNYALRIRNAAGIFAHPVVTVAGEQTTLELVTPVAEGGANIAAGDLWAFGAVDTESMLCLVADIAPAQDLAARLTLVPYNDAIYTAEDEPIPAYDPLISRPPDIRREIEAPIIESVVTDEAALVRTASGAFIPRIIIGVRFLGGSTEPPAYLQAAVRDSETEAWRTLAAVPNSAGRVVIDGVEAGQSYDVRVRAISAAGRTSLWTERENVVVVGGATPPPDVATFAVSELPSGARLFEWTMPAGIPVDVVGVQIRYALGTDLTWDDLAPLHTAALAASPYETGRLVAGTYTFGIKAVDAFGNLSENALIIERSLGHGTQGVLASEDARQSAWPGTLTGHVNERGDIEPPSSYTWDDLTTWDNWNAWNDGDQIVYEHSAIDLGAEYTVTPSATFDGDGDPTIEVRHSPDGSSWSSYAGIGTPTTDRHFQFRITLDGTVSFPLPILRQFIMYLFHGSLVRDSSQSAMVKSLTAVGGVIALSADGTTRLEYAGGKLTLYVDDEWKQEWGGDS
jgi:hypothetical protein